jgi:hydrogenase expression/formation protein HypD
MKYLNSDRNPLAAEGLLDQIREASKGPVVILNAVGGQVLDLLRLGTDRRLPLDLELINGLGCPVCALPIETIDCAIMAAEAPGVILCTPGELLRVPGSDTSLEEIRRSGRDIRTVYSALDALTIARKNPDRLVVFLAIGFETTAPAAASAVLEADRLGLDRFTIISAYLRYIPGTAALLDAPSSRVQAILAAGSVATVIGLRAFESLATSRGIPVVVTGPEPVDLLEGIRAAIEQIARADSRVQNQYERAVRIQGSIQAVAAIETVFEPVDVPWRGLGRIDGGGLALREQFRCFDAVTRLRLADPKVTPRRPRADLRCDEVVIGSTRPASCPAFAIGCTPERPLGAPMVSADGICSAFHRYRRPSAPPRNTTIPVLNTEVHGQATS